MTHLELITAMIDEARSEAGLSVAGLARLVDVEPKRLWRVLEAERAMQADEAVRLCLVLGIGLDQLSGKALGLSPAAEPARAALKAGAAEKRGRKIMMGAAHGQESD